MSVILGLFPLTTSDVFNVSKCKSAVLLDRGLSGKLPSYLGNPGCEIVTPNDTNVISDARARAVALHTLSTLIRSGKANENCFNLISTYLNKDMPISVPISTSSSAHSHIIHTILAQGNGLIPDVLALLNNTKASQIISRVALSSGHTQHFTVIVDALIGLIIELYQLPKSASIDLALGDSLELPPPSLLASIRRIRNVVADSKLNGASKEFANVLEVPIAELIASSAAASEAFEALHKVSKTSLKTLEGGSDIYRKTMLNPTVIFTEKAINQLCEALLAVLNSPVDANLEYLNSANDTFPIAASAREGKVSGGDDAVVNLEIAIDRLSSLLATTAGRCLFGLKTLEADQHSKALEKAKANPKVDLSKLKLKRLAVGKGADIVLARVFDDLKQLENLQTKVKGLEDSTLLLDWKEICDDCVASRNQEIRRPKLAKGTQDFSASRMAVRENVFNLIRNIFKRHGAVEIDTPMFELKETLTGKYGEDSKLIYDLKDQGGEALALRYDLTVPFARFLASNAIEKIKRYHFGKVYRRDEPQMTKGRFREFYQCDFDVAGSYDPLLPEAEVLAVMQSILGSLNLGEFVIKLNHRKLLNGMMTVAGVEESKHRPICSAIDKLDKESWDNVKKEMVEVKGLAESVADRLGVWVEWKGTISKITDKVLANEDLSANADVRTACEELKLLESYLTSLNHAEHVVLDLSLARGLDYYTGVIYEAILPGAGVGSVAAGGRYDGLVGMFSGKTIPAVGMSIGVERVFSVMEKRLNIANPHIPLEQQPGATDIQAAPTDVLVCSLGGESLTALRLNLCSQLWEAGVSTEFPYKAKLHPKKALETAIESGVPILLVIGEEEAANGTVRLRRFDAEDESKRFEEEVEMGKVVERVKEILMDCGTAGERLKKKMGI